MNLHNLMTCNRLESIESFYGGMVEPRQAAINEGCDVDEVACALCDNVATREVTYMKGDKSVKMLVCDNCFNDDDLWINRQIISTTNLK